MEDLILITELNDFIFCPVSIYFHKLYSEMDRVMYQSTDQINGTAAHERIDNGRYSTRKKIITGMNVYSEKYGLIGKIDTFNLENGILRERKRTIKKIYPGYIFQMYAQYFCLIEMGYKVRRLELYSLTDNKSYKISKPENFRIMREKFEGTLKEIRNFKMDGFIQENKSKCTRCIYEPACDRSSIQGEREIDK